MENTSMAFLNYAHAKHLLFPSVLRWLQSLMPPQDLPRQSEDTVLFSRLARAKISGT